MDMNKFLDILESNSSEKGEVISEALIHGDDVPEDLKKKYGFKWAFIPEKYNILIGLKKDSNDFETDKWEIISFEKASPAAAKAKAAKPKEFGESMTESIDPATYVEVAKSGDMNFIRLLGVIKDLLESKSIDVLHTTAAKLKTTK